MSIVKGLWTFMRVRKKFWPAAIIVVMLFFGPLLAFVQGSASAPLSARCSDSDRVKIPGKDRKSVV